MIGDLCAMPKAKKEDADVEQGRKLMQDLADAICDVAEARDPRPQLYEFEAEHGSVEVYIQFKPQVIPPKRLQH